MVDDKDIAANNIDSSESKGGSELLPPTDVATVNAGDEAEAVELMPVSSGIGGALAALGTALSGYHAYLPWKACCPLWLMLALPLIFVLPVLLPLYILWIWQRRVKKDLTSYANIAVADAAIADAAVVDLAAAEKVGVMLPKEKGYMLLGQRCKKRLLFLLSLVSTYYILIMLVILWSHHAVGQATEALRDTLQANPHWYEATSEQMLYAQQLVLIFSIAGAVFLFILLCCWAFTYLGLLRERSAVVFKQGCLLVLKNLPSIAILGVLFYLILMAIERVYAHCRMVALNNMMLGMEYFDPTLPFLVIRAYAWAVIMMTMVLILARGLHLFPDRKAVS